MKTVKKKLITGVAIASTIALVLGMALMQEVLIAVALVTLLTVLIFSGVVVFRLHPGDKLVMEEGRARIVRIGDAAITDPPEVHLQAKGIEPRTLDSAGVRPHGLHTGEPPPSAGPYGPPSHSLPPPSCGVQVQGTFPPPPSAEESPYSARESRSPRHRRTQPALMPVQQAETGAFPSPPSLKGSEE